MSTQANPAETIDLLLEHYLALLDEYTTLRGTLNTVQASIFQSLARANFSAERGIRYYGQDYYDERMQATRRVEIRPKDGGQDTDPAANRPPVLTVRTYPPSASESEPEPDTVSGTQDGSGSGIESSGAENPVSDSDSELGEVKPSAADDSSSGDGEEKQQGQEKREEAVPASEPAERPQLKCKPADPLRWFGILTPLALRQAQGHAIKAVEEIIPRLATLSVEMAAVELEVRRARKRRAKAEKAEEKRVTELADKIGQVDVNA
ncbi:hypothetical protein C8A03DRAFT_30136 [Achaetomium macrosporum]|uniref:Vacuolar ATPase assembly protein VMA22 n=1 Tax=Achaetomium macrosporum TaxID=79813 RepID=A0AAN7CGJ5_9PEZI|nr:hypothetical protein C8A03DRAFT_30136 [Achaetomium macrosporum]